MTRYEWDEDKHRANLTKHGISFETAILVFEDSHIVSDNAGGRLGSSRVS